MPDKLGRYCDSDKQTTVRKRQERIPASKRESREEKPGMRCNTSEVTNASREEGKC